MADNYHLPSRRPESPAEALFHAAHAFNDASRRTPSPQFAFPDRRNSQHVRRRSLEPVFEGEIKTLDNQRRSPMSHSAASPQPKMNLAKPRAPGSVRPNHRVSSHSGRSVQLRHEAILSAEVKTNVVITNEYLFMNELSYHLSLRYGRPLSSIVVSLQHGIYLLYGGSFDPAYILTITGLPDQVMATVNKRNASVFQGHLLQAIRVPPARGLVQFVPIVEDQTTQPLSLLARPPSTADIRGSELRQVKSPSPSKPAAAPSITSETHKSMQSMEEGSKVLPLATEQKVGDDATHSLYSQATKRRKGFMYSLFTR
ncbi:hypothetical protein EsDP_00002108 [Epichloe bromicola]|uniref:L-dopachrome isomerase n=1 Tax=Epichloe bromicola TaxID=79588 RepID=A0ABQ0CJT2_9HYPO